MSDHLLMVLEVLLLIWVVIQGEFVRFYEREVFRMNKDRYEERAKWRKEKQEQTRKKIAQKTSDSNASTGSPLSNETPAPPNKTTNAKSAVGPLMPTDTRASITSILRLPLFELLTLL
jgi:hypothetical protein